MAASRSTLVGQISRAVFWNATLLPLITVFSLAVAIVIRRSFGLESGIYDIGLGLLSTLLLYSSGGIPTSLTKFLPELQASGGRSAVITFLWRAGAARLVMLLVLLVAINLAPGWLASTLNLGELGVGLVLVISALVLIRAVAEIAIKILHSFFGQLWVNLLTLAQSALELTAVAVAVASGLGMIGAFGALTLSGLVIAALAIALAIRWLYRLELSATRVSKPGAAWQFASLYLSV